MSQLYVNARLRVQKDSVIHITRTFLGGRGKLHVAVGEEVAPGDILGEMHTSPGFRIIHLAKELGTSPKESFPFLKRRIGQSIYQGELLAVKKQMMGLGNKLIISPVDGIIDAYDDINGQLKISLLPKPNKLPSGMYGIIDAIDEEKGEVVIRTCATIVYGILGSGVEWAGMLRVLGSSADLIGTRQIPSGTHGQILVGGAMVFPEALEKAVHSSIYGIISGGINARDYQGLGKLDVGLTVLITEGFGSVPIGQDIFPLLKSYNNRFVILDGNGMRLILPNYDQNCMISVRRTSLPVGYAAKHEILEARPLTVGSKVRLIDGFLGQQGVVEAIDRSPTKLPSGITTFMITVLTSSKKIQIPYNNVEII